MTKCLAPWTHVFSSPQGEKRQCCASREPSQNFNQSIDTDKADGDVKLLSLHEHWNSDHMKSVRVRMMNGETLPECEVCDKKLLNTSVYADYFEHLFKHKRDELIEQTKPDGYLNVLPISFDYRFSNLCNFKCRMCGPQLSSQWEAEAKKHDPDIAEYEPWMKYTKELQSLQHEMYFEIYDQLKAGNLKEIYWVGGEPLMFQEHWDIMLHAVSMNHAKDIYVRYNTNLSKIHNTLGGSYLFDFLKHYKDYQICASIDGTGVIGEYIRTGLDYPKFIQNFEEGLQHSTNKRQMRLDFTLTTPGLFEIENMFNLSKKYNVELLTKVCFEFNSHTAMCPLFLPKDVLHPILTELINTLKPKADNNQRALIETLEHLLTRHTMEEKYDDFNQGRIKGKQTIEHLESIRTQPITMNEIFAQHNSEAYEFWNKIGK